MEEIFLLLIVFSAAEICTSYVLQPEKYRYVVIDRHEHCEERWYTAMTWATIDQPTEKDGQTLGAYLGGFNSDFKKIRVNLKARVSGEIGENGNWTLRSIAFNIMGQEARDTPFPYSQRIKIIKEPATIYCAQVPKEGEDILYFKDIMVTTKDERELLDDSNILYVILDEPMQFLIKIIEKDETESVYHLLIRTKRSIVKSNFFIPKLDL